MSEEPPTQRAVPERKPPKKAVQRITDVLATLIGIGVILAGGAVLLEDGPVGSGLTLFIAGLALLPFIPVPGRGSRTTIFIFALGYAIGMPVYDRSMVLRQTIPAVESARDTAAKLSETVAKSGQWPDDLAAALPDKIQVDGDGWSRDVMLTDCGGARCTLLVTLTDARYRSELRERSFGLWTQDGGTTWECGPAGEHSVMPHDLPSSCRDTGSR